MGGSEVCCFPATVLNKEEWSEPTQPSGATHTGDELVSQSRFLSLRQGEESRGRGF